MTDLGVERFGVTLAAEHLRAVALSLRAYGAGVGAAKDVTKSARCPAPIRRFVSTLAEADVAADSRCREVALHVSRIDADSTGDLVRRQFAAGDQTADRLRREPKPIRVASLQYVRG
jgi:hypothetical protein